MGFVPARVTAVCVCVCAGLSPRVCVWACKCVCTSVLKRVFNSLLYTSCRPGNWHPIDAAMQGGLFSFPGAHQSNRGRCRCSPDLSVCLTERACVYVQLEYWRFKSKRKKHELCVLSMFSWVCYSHHQISRRREPLGSQSVSSWGQNTQSSVIQFYLRGKSVLVFWTWSWLGQGFLMVNGS